MLLVLLGSSLVEIMCGQDSGWWLLHYSPSSLVGVINAKCDKRVRGPEGKEFDGSEGRKGRSLTYMVRGLEGKEFDIDGCQPALDFACSLWLDSHTVWMRSSALGSPRPICTIGSHDTAGGQGPRNRH